MPGLRGIPEVMTTTSEFGRRLPALVVGAVADDARIGPLDRARLEHVQADARRPSDRRRR